MPAEIWDTSMTEAPVIVEQAKREKDGTIAREQINCSTDNSETDDDYKIDKLFDRICCFGLMLGVNFHGKRSEKARCISLIIVAFHCCINLYFVGYVISLTIRKPFETDRIAATIGICTWVLQALLSTIFLAYWQHTEQPQKILRLLYAANKGVGIHHNRKSLLLIVKSFYAVIASVVCYYVILMICNLLEVKAGYWNSDLSLIFGDRRLFVIVQFSCLYCKLCWAVAIFVYGLLIHAANYEFEYYNEQVRKIECKDVSMPDEALCRYLLSLMKIHTRLTECVKRLDQMFNASFAPSIIYAFVMIATIIPTTIFFSFMIFRFVPSAKNWELLLLSPLIVYCTMSFVALLNAPSRLHNTIYSTKSALCANTYVWFPYRCNVYHSAVAFACHLDQANLGISIWGFAVVSKPLVLTTLSVMTTCLALFLDIGDCSSNSAHRAQTL